MIGQEDKKLLNMAIDNTEKVDLPNPCYNKFSKEQFKKSVKDRFNLYKEIHAEAEKENL